MVRRAWALPQGWSGSGLGERLGLHLGPSVEGLMESISSGDVESLGWKGGEREKSEADAGAGS